MSTTQQRRTLYNKQNNKRNHSLFTNKLLGHVTKAAGIKVFLISKSESRLVKDRCQKSGSIQEQEQERSLTELTPMSVCPRVMLTFHLLHLGCK